MNHLRHEPDRPALQPLLSPLLEIPGPELIAHHLTKKPWTRLSLWFQHRLQMPSPPLIILISRSSYLHFLLEALAYPLAPVPIPVSPTSLIKYNPIKASSAQYIVHQYTAATGGSKLQSFVRNLYAMGKLNMVASESDAASSKLVRSAAARVSARSAEEAGCFVVWQTKPDMWCIDLALAGCKARAGCDGKLAWRQTPSTGTHKVKGPVRPLRRVLQGLDPCSIANMFAHAHCIGEKSIDGETCFILKLVAEPSTLHARSNGRIEIFRHIMFGYFSQRTGLLVHLEDSNLLRIQEKGADTVVYREFITKTSLEDYRSVEGMIIPHAGRTVSILFKFGEITMSQYTSTRLEETWVIEEVAFNVQGVSRETFIAPGELDHEGTIMSELASEFLVQEGGMMHQENGPSEVASLSRSEKFNGDHAL